MNWVACINVSAVTLLVGVGITLWGASTKKVGWTRLGCAIMAISFVVGVTVPLASGALS
jgi:hypothetical protein